MEIRRRLSTLAHEIEKKIEAGELERSQIDLPLPAKISAIDAEITQKHTEAEAQNRQFALQELRKYQPRKGISNGLNMEQTNADLRYFRQLEALRSGKTLKPEEISASVLLKFAAGIFENKNGWLEVMEKHPEIWQDKDLPWQDDGKTPLKLLSIKNQVFQIGVEMEAGAMFRKKFSCANLTPEQTKLLIDKWILKQPANTYNPEEKFSIAAWLFNNKMSDILDGLLKRNDFFTADEISQWRNFFSSLSVMNEQIKLLSILVAINNDIQKKNWDKAMLNALKLQSEPRANKYKKIASETVAQLLWYFPELHPLYFKYLEDNAMAAKDFSAAIAMAATAEERSSQDKKTRNLSRNLKNTTVRGLPLPSDINPFERQIKPPPPGMITRWLEGNWQMHSSNPAYQLVIATDLGDRQNVFELLRKPVRLENTGDWQTSLLYDYGVAATQFGEISAVDYTAKIMSMDSTSPFMVLKYGIVIRDYPQTLKLASPISRRNNMSGYQAALARLLIQIQYPEFGESDFRHQAAEIQREFASLKLQDDFLVINWCAEVFNNKKPASLPELKSCQEKELLALMICDVAARDRFLDRRNLENIDLPAIPNDSCYYTHWWRRSALLTLTSGGPSILNWLLRLPELELDYRIAALPSYPMLKQLKTAALVITGQDKENRIQDIIELLEKSFGEDPLWQERLVIKDLKTIASAGAKK